jgi:hypothetical protein
MPLTKMLILNTIYDMSFIKYDWLKCNRLKCRWFKSNLVNSPFDSESDDGQNRRIGNGLGGNHFGIADHFTEHPGVLAPQQVELKGHGWNKKCFLLHGTVTKSQLTESPLTEC